MLLDGLSALSNDMDKDVLYGLLLVLSGILMDKNGELNYTLVDCCHLSELFYCDFTFRASNYSSFLVKFYK